MSLENYFGLQPQFGISRISAWVVHKNTQALAKTDRTHCQTRPGYSTVPNKRGIRIVGWGGSLKI